MILYRKEPYPLQMKNIMLLDDIESGGVVYVSKSTYDQALLLHGRFDGNTMRVADAINCKKTGVYITMQELYGLIDNMSKTMPEPINILAPFLMFCVQNEGIEWDSKDRVFAYGILHQYSQLIDFNAMTLVPAEVRNIVTLPTMLLKQYETSWNDLCSTLEDKVVLGAVQQTPITSTTSIQNTTPITEVKAETKPAVTPKTGETKVDKNDESAKGGEEEMTPFEKMIRGLNTKAKSDYEEAKKKTPTPLPKPAPKAQPVSAPAVNKTEATQNSAILDEFDI